MISDDAPDPRNGKIIQCRVLAPDPFGPVGRFVSGALARGTLSLCGWSPSPPPVPNFRRPSTARARQIPLPSPSFLFFCPACSSLLLAGGSSLSPALLFYALRRRPTRLCYASRVHRRREKMYRDGEFFPFPPLPPFPGSCLLLSRASVRAFRRVHLLILFSKIGRNV